MLKSTRWITTPAMASCALVLAGLARPCHGQSIAADFSADLALTDIGSSAITGVSRVTQMAWHPVKPTSTTRYLYMATTSFGIRRLTYDETTATFQPGSLEVVAANIRGNGIAFHGHELYATEGYESVNQPNAESDRIRLSRLWRIADGGFGERTAIVEGIPRDDHDANHIQIIGDRLYVGIGTRTRNGAFQMKQDIDDYGESAYGGTIAVIDDLTAVGSGANAAGFFLPQPDLTEYENLINGTDPAADDPFTTMANNKLRIHSAGTRNPFGMAADGDGNIWFTTNFQQTENHVYDRDNLIAAEGDGFGGDGFQDDVHDQFFRAFEKADYGYRNSNWQDGNVPGNTGATSAGFYQPQNRTASFTFDNYVDPIAANEHDGSNPAFNQDYDVDHPVGLGPSSSSNGFDFYQGNSLPLKFHKDAFVARWVETNSDGGDSLTFQDVVSIDTDAGDVNRIAVGFVNPLDVIADGLGNLLVADWSGSIYRISPQIPVVDAHQFTWDTDTSGNYSDRLAWNADSLPAEDRLAPHAWGTARYDVTIDRPGGNPLVTLDQSATVEDLTLGDALNVAAGNTLTVQGQLTVQAGGTLLGQGVIAGAVLSSGIVAPGSSIGELVLNSYAEEGDARLQVELEASGHDRLTVMQTANVGGVLEVSLLDGFSPILHDSFEVLTAAGGLEGSFATTPADLPDLDAGLAWRMNYEPTSLVLEIIESFTADLDHDGDVDDRDLAIWVSAFGVDSQADADGDGDSDGSDFLAWQVQTGSSLGLVAPGAAVPEPTSALLGLIALAARWVFGARRSSGGKTLRGPSG